MGEGYIVLTPGMNRPRGSSLVMRLVHKSSALAAINVITSRNGERVKNVRQCVQTARNFKIKPDCRSR